MLQVNMEAKLNKMKRKQKKKPHPKLNLPILQIFALELHSLAFFYIPKFPVKFNRDYTALIISESRLQWFTVGTLFAHILLHGLITGLFAVYVIVFPQHNMDVGWERLLMLVLVSLGFTGATLFGLSILKYKDCLISSFNELLKMKRALTLSGNIIQTEKEPDRYGNAMLMTAIICLEFPFWFAIVPIYMDYDTADYIFKMTLNDPMYWDIINVYFTLVVRTLLLFTTGLELSRSGGFFLICLFILGDQASKVVECMRDLRFSIFNYLYTLLRIIYGKIQIWAQWFIFALAATFFWSTVVSCYFVIVCWKSATLIIYLGAIICVFALVFTQVTLGPYIVDSIKLARDVVGIHRTKVRTIRAQQKCDVSLRNLKVAMAISPIRILCGSFKTVDREYLREHFELQLARLFDAIMIS